MRGLERDGAGVRIVAREGGAVAGVALLATGKHDLPAWRRGAGAATVGLKLHLDLADAQRRQVAEHVELALFRGGYAGLQLIEDGVANLCLVVERDRFAALGHDWRRLVAAVPHLARRLAGAEIRHARPLAVAGMPYGWLAEAGAALPVYRLGDQAAVIPSFTGDGMAMALRSARHAAEAVLAGRPADIFQGELAAGFRRPVRRAGLIAGFAATAAGRHLFAAAASLAPGLLERLAAATRLGAPVRR